MSKYKKVKKVAAKAARKEVNRALNRRRDGTTLVSRQSTDWYFDFTDLERHRAETEEVREQLHGDKKVITITSEHLLLNR